MSTLKELLVQQEELAKRIEELRITERNGAIEQVRGLIADYQLTQLDLFESESPANPVVNKKPVVKVPAKYRDMVSGKEWTGRGNTPKWISESGKDKSEFLIDKVHT